MKIPIMKKTLILLFITFSSLLIKAQMAELRGTLTDEKKSPLPYATVTLMRPSDSSLLYYGITNLSGTYEIGKIKPGEYLFQAASMGYQTINRKIILPVSDNSMGVIQMSPQIHQIDGVEIKAEYIPMLIKKDTIEYNAGAFKVKPDGVAEDILRKLPGVEVDRSGNIKALGEDVQNVLVDGKEFFSNDPKVTTKNLPAEAIKKVQVYDKKSEEADLSGIEDASREKTINFVLKEGQKQAWFGEVSAGGGTGDHYAANAKVYRFTKTKQIAMLGMLNNTNKSGFSLQDYIDFNGGLSSMMSGSSRISLSFDNSAPIDFGNKINGLLTSGAAGMNYSVELKKDRRFYGSYLGNASERKLHQNSVTDYFYQSGSQTSKNLSDDITDNQAHRINLGYRDRSDSTTALLFNVNAGLTASNNKGNLSLLNLAGPLTVNSLERYDKSNGNKFSGNLTGSWLKKFDGSLRLFKMALSGSSSHSLDKNEWNSITRFWEQNSTLAQSQQLENKTNKHDYTLSASTLFVLAHRTYLEPGLKAGFTTELTGREQGAKTSPFVPLDSLSPDFENSYHKISPSLTLRKNWKKLKTEFSLETEAGWRSNQLNKTNKQKNQDFYLLPSASMDYEITNGHRASLSYYTEVNNPTANQLMPIVNNTNPLLLYYGNRNLKPEYQQTLSASWMLFDQFSQTSVFSMLNGNYIKDKINLDRSINDSLAQTIRLINVDNDYNLSGTVNFSTPIKWLRTNIHLGYTGSWNRGQNIINGIMNKQTNLTHEGKISFDNRLKEKIDVEIGSEISFTDAKYSVQKNLNNKYFNYSWFADVKWTPTQRWNFGASADVVNYTNKSFGSSLTIPIVDASVSYNFMKSNRAMILLEVADILNKNKGIERISEQNYLKETRSNTIGRFAMLTFRYKLNQFDTGKSAIEIKTRKH